MEHLYLVTGANGHLGYTVCHMLRDQAKHVRGLILPKDKEDRLLALGVDIYHGDITKPETLDAFFDFDEHIDLSQVVLIHCAGIVSISKKKNPLIEKVNVEGTKRIVDLVKHKKIGKMIYVSSVHAILEKPHGLIIDETKTFDPNLVIGAYAKSKALASKHVIEAIHDGLPAIIVHPSGIIGPEDQGHGHMTMMIEDYLNGYLTSRVNGAYDFVDVRDAADGILRAVKDGHVGETYILSGTHIDLKQLFVLLQAYSGKKRAIHVLPRWFARLSAPLAEVYYKLRKLPPIYSSYSLYTLRSNSHFSHEKATRELGYQPRPIEDTIKDTLLWLAMSNRVKKVSIKAYIQRFIPLKKKSGL